MTYPPRPYRSDFNARISYALHHRTLEIAIWTIAVAVTAVLWLGGDLSPFEIMRARGGF